MHGDLATILRPPTGSAFAFDPGALCLALAATGGEGDLNVYETLHAPSDLAAWIRSVLGAGPSRVDSATLAQARRLRAAIWQLAEAAADGRPVPPRAAAAVNRTAGGQPPARRIGTDGVAAWAGPVTAAAALALVARDAVDLFGGPRRARVRRCAGERCRLIFADESRSGRRRWCSMQRCGNRAKVRAFRDRTKEDSDEQ